jgi:hypothetical protein
MKKSQLAKINEKVELPVGQEADYILIWMKGDF